MFLGIAFYFLFRCYVFSMTRVTLIQYLNFDLKNNELNSSLVVSASDIEIQGVLY